MKKAAELRRHLSGHVPELKANPDKLVMFITRGAVACRAGSLSFQWAYDVEIIVTDYAGHPDALVVPILAWMSLHQPEQFQNSAVLDRIVRVEAELIDHERSDVQLTVSLTERVIVQAAAGGGWTANHCDDPPPDDMSGVAPWSLVADGEEL